MGSQSGPPLDIIESFPPPPIFHPLRLTPVSKAGIESPIGMFADTSLHRGSFSSLEEAFDLLRSVNERAP